jgi:hypothetical protein
MFAFLAKLLTLCSSETIVRTMTYYSYSLRNWGLEDLRPFFGPLNDHITLVSSDYNIPVAMVDLAFNGPDGDESAEDKGYPEPDRIHPSALGAEVIADLHRKLGYEYTSQ